MHELRENKCMTAYLFVGFVAFDQNFQVIFTLDYFQSSQRFRKCIMGEGFDLIFAFAFLFPTVTM